MNNQRIKEKILPKDYVSEAEKNIQGCRNIKTSQLRKILSLFTDSYNYENLQRTEKLSPKTCENISLARIRLVYQAGRMNEVRNFLEKSQIQEYLRGIGDDREAFLNFFHYLEALVAYHKFYGGRE